tara:strand:+ start:967 stop:4071 length:3105 start_codon:yes stop_codon:yes gene_type:complete
MSRKKGKGKFSMSKMGKVPFRKKARNKFIKWNTDQRGMWTTHRYIIKDDPVNEMNIKNSLCPDGGIDVTKIDNMIKGVLTREDELLRRYHDEGIESLSKIDNMRVKNLLAKINSNITRDIEGITKSRFNHKPITPEGSFMIKMLWLERFLSKNLKEKIAHMYLKIKDDGDDLVKLKLPEDLKVKYSEMLDKLNSLIETYDMIDLQLGPLSNSVTPLNQKGFKKLEDFQVRVIEIIQENEKLDIANKKSILVKAPTSAGKTALAGYLFTKEGRFIVSVPTNALAWQLSAMISKIMNINVPLVTDTYQSALKTSDLVKLIIKSRCVVGTPRELVTILGRPEFESVIWDWLMLDEIHMLGKKEGAWMEALIKAYPETPVLALSATIGNEIELGEWIKNSGRAEVEVVVYDKRFINLQRFVYRDGSIQRINPLSMVSLEDFKTGIVLDKTIVPTPQDVYMIYKILRKEYPDEQILYHEKFFESNQRLSLDSILNFFNNYLKFMTRKVQKDDVKMIRIIEELQLSEFESSNVNLVDVFFNLKEEKKCPAIAFHKNSSIIMEYAYQIHNDITQREMDKYPKLVNERLRYNKKFKQQQKKDDNDDTMKKINDTKSDSSKIEIKMQKKLAEMQALGKVEERFTEKDIFEPHPDFIFTPHQYNSKAIVQNWEYNVNPNKDKFFPRDGDCWHWVLMLLYRGIGIYCKGLPDPYLRIVQQMANDKKLAIVLSDKELVFGVSMPFRTSIILNDDSLDSMEYHQMAGRAGRRGLDKEGNVVFVGQSSERIRNLSISIIPNVSGSSDCLHYGMKVIEKLSKSSRWNKISSNMLVSTDNNKEEITEFFEGISENQSSGGVWDYVDNLDNTHLLYLMWQFRQTDECIMLPLILQHLESGFARARSTNEGDQISAAHYLLHFIEIEESESESNKLPSHPLMLTKYNTFYNSMKDDEEGYAFDISDNIDGNLYYSIRENRIIPTSNIMEKHKLRERLDRFIYKLRAIQHYYYHMSFEKTILKSRYMNICKLLGKLFTRLKWIYHMSSKLAEK